ncbi:PadR family transcriptional regulator [Kineococcus sp. SYSU DK004]|uniref:PadR family transcriptional regulator n=1 Tax=Kineococcus sp. SYSU DK004 TaxID=3383125 RepID=UPI003D7D1929
MSATPDAPWPAEWMRGVLSLCVLGVVAEGRTYGYAVATRLARAGLGAVKGGTLYPVLGRLEADGFVTSSWGAGDGGPGRKFFDVTDAGRRHLAERAGAWRTFTSRAASLLPEGDGAPVPAAVGGSEEQP